MNLMQEKQKKQWKDIIFSFCRCRVISAELTGKTSPILCGEMQEYAISS